MCRRRCATSGAGSMGQPGRTDPGGRPGHEQVVRTDAATPLRLLLGQSGGLDLPRAIADRKIVVMPLSRGLVGSETAALLSSLMLASLWQALLRRVRVAQAERHPFWLYVDEAAEVVRLPIDLADMLAEARGIGSGITLATQYLAQLPTAVRDALLATVRSQVAFQLESADARLLARTFAPTLDEHDLRNLPPHEVAMRLAVDGRTSRPMTGLTRPLPPVRGSGMEAGAELPAASREQYGVARAEVEAAVRERGVTTSRGGPVGKRRTAGDDA